MEKELPKSWKKVKLYEVCLPVSTGVYEFKGIKKYFSTGSIKAHKTLPEGHYTYKNRPSRANRIAKENDILQARMAETDKAILINAETENQLFSTGFIHLRTYHSALLPKLVFYYCKSNQFNSQKNELASGSTQVAINDKNAKKISFPLPPLPEQHRIVVKLDKLFRQLEVINASLDEIPVLLGNFRQQVLTQAVTGKLTEKWRKGKDLRDWNIKKLKEIGNTRLGKMLDKAKNSGEFVDYLRNTNIRWFDIDFNDLYQMKVQHEELSKYELKFNDILVCEGGEPGRAAIWKYNRKNIIFQKALHRIRLNKDVLPEYFVYHIKVDASSGELNQHFTGTTIKHLTGKEFSKYKIAIPPIDEQQEIINQVESLFQKADAIDKKFEELKKRINNLPQTILSKAFKGELVPQLESDGDARELFKDIKKLKEQNGGKVLKGSRKVKKCNRELELNRAAEEKEDF